MVDQLSHSKANESCTNLTKSLQARSVSTPCLLAYAAWQLYPDSAYGLVCPRNELDNRRIPSNLQMATSSAPKMVEGDPGRLKCVTPRLLRGVRDRVQRADVEKLAGLCACRGAALSAPMAICTSTRRYFNETNVSLGDSKSRCQVWGGVQGSEKPTSSRGARRRWWRNRSRRQIKEA